ncbi:hypothetical protein JL720_688 [Aureococcus anophagefferens]|nr:hypothetical protein JL720_688 [Aureococcus anophagefferens]
MMTFLPLEDFLQSALSLDDKRLQNQRTEARFVLEWLEGRGFELEAYGAARMWRGYRDALAAYYNACLEAYEARGKTNGPTMPRAAAKADDAAAPARREPEADSRATLVDEYLRLTKKALPALAKAHKWPIRFDHRFMRVMLDNSFGCVWYEKLDRKKGSAISQIDADALRRAVGFGKRMEAEGLGAVQVLDNVSLRLRGKEPKRVMG